MSKIRMGLYELMRLKNIYLICKKNLEAIKGLELIKGTQGNSTIYVVKNSLKLIEALKEMITLDFIQADVSTLYNLFPVFNIDKDSYNVSVENGLQIIEQHTKIITEIKAIINMYESMSEINDHIGFDIKLPNFDNFSDFVSDLRELDFILNQCPFLKDDDEEIKFNNVDIGSTWLTFVIAAGVASKILHNLAALVDKAIVIKSHMITLKQQEEVFKSMEMANNTYDDVTNVYKEYKNILLKQARIDLEQKIVKLDNGEEEGKAEKSLEKLAILMEKGLQIYTSINAPDEVKALFPPVEIQNSIISRVGKYITKKEE